MKAYVCRSYGAPDVLELADVAKPEPKNNEILVRVHATSVTSGDRRMRSFDMPKGMGWIGRLVIGLHGPRQPILGTELSGVVEAVGSAVTRFAPGDQVFAFPGGKMGCYAEYVCVAEDGPVAPKPAILSHPEAASLCFGGYTALDFLHKADVKSGQNILIIGASGGVGTALVQLASHRGALVTTVTSAANVELVRSLGAHRTFDYGCDDFTKAGVHYDVIFDVVGATSFGACKAVLAREGKYVAIAGGLGEMLATLWVPLTGRQRVIAGPANERVEYIAELANLVVTGALKPVIDRIYAFESMAEAHEYVDSGRKQGSVVLVLV